MREIAIIIIIFICSLPFLVKLILETIADIKNYRRNK